MNQFNYKKYFLTTLVGALSISALIGIYIFLVGDFGETEGKILATTLSLGGFSLLGLACAASINKPKLRTFSKAGMIFSVIGLLLTISIIWEILDPDDTWMTTVMFLILSFSFAHVSLLLLISPKTKGVKIVLTATIVCIGIVAVMLIKTTFNEFNDGDFYLRLLGVFAILDALGTITTPILNKISDAKDETTANPGSQPAPDKE
ncbi:MAG: hypothetical protein M3R25_10310 [Bacteroidota bacterium]|nr:hypothetical protein [Bacteroidota bacterium]